MVFIAKMKVVFKYLSISQHTKILTQMLYFSVDKLHPWMAGPLGGPEKQHTELLQVSG